MTTDDIARVLAALHDITPEKVRAVIEGAEKLRGLGVRIEPTKDAPIAPEPVKAPEPPPASQSPSNGRTMPNGASAAVFRYLQSGETSHLKTIALSAGLTYEQASNALTGLCRSGRAERVQVGFYRLGQNAEPPLSAPGHPPKSAAAVELGKASAASKPESIRSEITKMGAAARWAKAPKLPSEHPPIPPPIDSRKRAIPAAPFITKHIRERWAEHHDDVSNEAILTSYSRGIELDVGIVAQVTNVARRGAGDSTYRLSPDRRGIFVVGNNLGSQTLVTYLRLTEKHVEWFLEHYPIAGVITTAH
jgi:hypothetical protein